MKEYCVVATNKESIERAELHRKIWAIADDVRGASQHLQNN